MCYDGLILETVPILRSGRRRRRTYHEREKRMMELQLTARKLAEICPYEKNPRRNDPAVDAVAESICQCGYVAPIVVDEGGTILAGHTRYRALKKLGRKEVQVIVKAGLNEEQKRKYRLLDNKTAELAEWDLDLLAEELEGLDFEGLALDWPEAEEEAVPAGPAGGGNVEYGLEEFGDEAFGHQCPKCGFKFND